MRNPSLGVFGLVSLAIGVLASPCTHAQDANKVWKVGILWHAANLQEEMVMFRPFAEGMRELGYVEGRNVIFDHTFVDEKYERFPANAQELVNRKVDIIMASLQTAAVAAGRVTKAIRIVFATAGDPVRAGLVESMRRPGGNLTRLSLFYPELAVKHLEMLHDPFRATCWATGSVVYRAVALSAIVTRDAASSTLVGVTSLSLFIGNKRAREPLIAPNRLMT